MLQGETVKFCQSSLAVIQDMLLTVEVANLRRISSFLKEHNHPPPAEASAESIIRSVQGPGGAAKLLKSMTGLLNLVYTRVTGNPPQPGQSLRDIILGILRSLVQVHIAA